MATSVTDARISDKGRVELQISVPPTDVAGLLDECEEELARAGGIIPDGKRSTLEARYGKQRLETLVNEWLMDRVGTETLGVSENPLVGFSQFFLVENGYPVAPFVFQAVSYELPKGTLSSVEPLVLGPKAKEVSPEALDHAIKSLLHAYGAQRPTDEKRPAALGDTVKVDVEVTAGGVPVTTFCKRAAALKLDYTSMPASFIDQVAGMVPGDTKEFSYTVPGIEGVCPDESFDAKVNLIALYFVDEPKPTPAWIKGRFPGMKNEQDLRAAMAQNLSARAGGLPSKEDAIDEALFERLAVDVPDEMVDFIAERMWHAEAERMHAQGMGLDAFCAVHETTPDEFREKLHALAARDLKLSVALDALYEAKGFTLTERDLDMIFEQMAPGRAAEMKHGYTLSGRLHLAEELAQRAKARRWLSDTATLA